MIKETIDCIFYEAKALSHDPDTQVAAFVQDPTGEIIFAANALPPGVERTEERTTRPNKYSWIQHAEKTVIIKAARQGISLEGCAMYLSWFPCVDCAGAVVLAGIKEIYCDYEAYIARIDDPKYSFALAAAILSAGGVDLKWLA